MKTYHKFIPHPLLVFLYGSKIRMLRLIYRFIFLFKVPNLRIRPSTTDIQVFHDIFIKKELDSPININPKLIIDCGAYVGFSSIFFNLKYPQANIVAIEPEPGNYKALLNNCLNFKNIKPINAAVWNKEATLQINSGQGEWSFEMSESISSNGNVSKGITINQILNESGIDKIDVLKIDIEGAEVQLFDENCHSWLSKVKVIYIELHDRKIPGCSDNFYKAISHYKWDKFKNGEKIILYRDNG